VKTLIPAALVSLAAGFGLGLFYERHHGKRSPEEAAPKPADGAPEAKPDSGLEARAAAAETLAGEREAELKKAKARIRELEAKDGPVGPAAAKKKPESPEEIAAYLEEAKKRIEELVAKKDGKALVKLMHELAALGEPGYMLAIEISGIIAADVQGGSRELGLSQNEFYMAFGGPMTPLLVWGLQKGEEIPAGFRVGAAWSLPWQKDVDAGKLFLEVLKTEKNADVARAISQNLEGILKPEMAGDLAAAAKANSEDPAVLAAILGNLGAIGNDEAARYLDEFAASDNATLRTEAEIALLSIRPPAAGVLITYTAPNSQAEIAGLQRGDIITSYNGQPVTDMDALRDRIEETSGDQLVSVTVNRKGEIVTLQLKGSKVGIGGKGVAPK
jgi:hypothetical protein